MEVEEFLARALMTFPRADMDCDGRRDQRRLRPFQRVITAYAHLIDLLGLIDGRLILINPRLDDPFTAS